LALPIIGDLLPRIIEGGIERGMGDGEGYRTDRVGDSIGDPDPDPQHPHVLPFSHKGVDRTKRLLAKLNFNTKLLPP
jgi:hypothetical protein